MSVNDLSEGIMLTELHVCAVGEDANNETKELVIYVSRIRRNETADWEGKEAPDQSAIGQENQDGGKIVEKSQSNRWSSLLFN